MSVGVRSAHRYLVLPCLLVHTRDVDGRDRLAVWLDLHQYIFLCLDSDLVPCRHGEPRRYLFRERNQMSLVINKLRLQIFVVVWVVLVIRRVQKSPAFEIVACDRASEVIILAQREDDLAVGFCYLQKRFDEFSGVDCEISHRWIPIATFRILPNFVIQAPVADIWSEIIDQFGRKHAVRLVLLRYARQSEVIRALLSVRVLDRER